MNDYIHDVFISYKQESEIWNRWIEELFFACLNRSLTNAMSNHRDPRICFDRKSFLVGEPLTETVRINVIKSRVLVCLWSPKYFESVWCRQELTIMLKRRQLHDNKRLILPVGIMDGDRFPDLIHQLNLFKLEEIQKRELANPFMAMHTPQTHELSIIINKWVQKDVYPAILDAPRYNTSWETMELDTDTFNNLEAKPQDHHFPDPVVIL
jgi:hypothetical protein